MLSTEMTLDKLKMINHRFPVDDDDAKVQRSGPEVPYVLNSAGVEENLPSSPSSD